MIAIAGAGLSVAIWLGLLGAHVFGCLRFVQIIRSIVKGQLGPSGIIGGLFGTLAIAILAIAILGVWVIVIVTFFFMRTGSASGIPIAFAFMGFPFVWLACEAILAVSYKRSYGRAR